MYLITLIFSFLFAVFFASLLSWGFNRKGPGPFDGFLFFILIIFLFSWVIGGLIAPFGPVHWGVSWLGYMLLAMVVMLLLGVLLPPQKPPQKAEGKAVTDYELFEKNAVAYPIGISIGMFFWVMIVVLLIIAGFRIYYQTM